MGSTIGIAVSTLRDRFGREGGAVATEYGLILSLIALAIIAAMAVFGLVLMNMLGVGADEVQSVTGG